MRYKRLAILAALFLLLPLNSVTYVIFSDYKLHTGAVLMLFIIGAAALISGILALYYAKKNETNSYVFSFFKKVIATNVLIFLFGTIYGLSQNVPDSGHGTLLVVMFMGVIGFALAATSWVARCAHREQGLNSNRNT